MGFTTRAVVLALAATLGWIGTASATVFPSAGGSYSVNVLRRYTGSGVPTPSVAAFDSANVSHSPASRAVDGAGEKLQWNGNSANNPALSGWLQVTLPETILLSSFDHTYIDAGYRPAGYEIKVSTTGFGAMTTVVSSAAQPAQTQTDTLGSPVAARYIEYRWLGTGPSTQYVLLQEFRAYASTTNPVPIDTGMGFDLIGMGSATATKLTADWQGADAATNITDRNQFSYLRGDGASGGNGNAVVQVDLGFLHDVRAFSLGFYQDQTWGSGAKIEVSPDNVNFYTLFNQTSSLTSSQDILTGAQIARYIRLTNYGGSTGALSDLQVFGLPEPATGLVLALGCGAALLRRRRR